MAKPKDPILNDYKVRVITEVVLKAENEGAAMAQVVNGEYYEEDKAFYDVGTWYEVTLL